MRILLYVGWHELSFGGGGGGGRFGEAMSKIVRVELRQAFVGRSEWLD